MHLRTVGISRCFGSKCKNSLSSTHKGKWKPPPILRKETRKLLETHELSNLLSASRSEVEDLLSKVRTVSWNNFGKKIHFYAPTFLPYKSAYTSTPSLFPSISITGTSCSLRCAHCNGKMLETMIPVDSPSGLVELCQRIEKDGGVGCLVSGGCRPDGSVPLEPFVDAIGEVKRRTGLTVVVHTGVLNIEMARRLADARIDAALIDIIGSNETIREIYRLDARVEDYENSMQAFHDSNVPFVPHVLVGLHYGQLKGELKALQAISKHDPAALIFIAFIPIRGTSMEVFSPPDPFDVAKVMISARSLMPNIPHALGCARPTSEHRKETDVLAVRAGINAIAFPTDEAILTARNLGLQTCFSSMCCSQVYSDMLKIRS